MSTRLKIYGGTVSDHSPRLCDTCRYGVVRRGAAATDEEVFCTGNGRKVHTQIVECSAYVDRSKTTLREMEQIAWVLHTDSKRQQVGFVRAIDWKRQHEDEELLPAHLRNRRA
jgi:hypothetical protein